LMPITATLLADIIPLSRILAEPISATAMKLVFVTQGDSTVQETFVP
jgi:hypothetical protein